MNPGDTLDKYFGGNFRVIKLNEIQDSDKDSLEIPRKKTFYLKNSKLDPIDKSILQNYSLKKNSEIEKTIIRNARKYIPVAKPAQHKINNSKNYKEKKENFDNYNKIELFDDKKKTFLYNKIKETANCTAEHPKNNYYLYQNNKKESATFKKRIKHFEHHQEDNEFQKFNERNNPKILNKEELDIKKLKNRLSPFRIINGNATFGKLKKENKN